MRLNTLHRDILRFVSLRSSGSVEEIASQLGYKSHSVRRALFQLIEERIIRKSILVSPYKLGYTPHNLHFNLASPDPLIRQRVLQWIVNHPQISWCGQMVGDFDFELTFLSRNVNEFTVFIDQISAELGKVFASKHLAVEKNQIYFGYKVISPTPIPVLPLFFEECEQKYTLDTLDIELLKSLASGGENAIASVAKQQCVSISSLNYRKQRLKDRGILIEETYFPDRNRILTAHLAAMLSISSPGEPFRSKFLRFCIEHKNVFCCHRCVGAWDYKVGIIGESREEVGAALDLMKATFIDDITSIRIGSFMKELKDNFFPYYGDSTNLKPEQTNTAHTTHSNMNVSNSDRVAKMKMKSFLP